jgi:serine/threonine protein kinase
MARRQFYGTNAADGTATVQQSSEEINIHDHYTLGPMIGEGNFASVYVCTRRNNGIKYALKVIDKEKLKGKERLLDNELALLSRVSHHPNVVALIESFDTPQYLYLVTELVTGGDLFDVLMEAQPCSELFVSSLVKDVACALRYLHEMNIVHRDLKPENLLFHTDDIGGTTLKVGDFGLAKKLAQPTSRMKTICGTPKYVAPEVLRGNYGKKCDMWSLGVVIFVMLSGTCPFESRNQKVRRTMLTKWSDCS